MKTLPIQGKLYGVLHNFYGVIEGRRMEGAGGDGA